MYNIEELKELKAKLEDEFKRISKNIGPELLNRGLVIADDDVAMLVAGFYRKVRECNAEDAFCLLYGPVLGEQIQICKELIERKEQDV